MTKIIENPKNRLMEEVRRQVQSIGYSAMTIRSLATVCNLSPEKRSLLKKRALFLFHKMI